MYIIMHIVHFVDCTAVLHGFHFMIGQFICSLLDHTFYWVNHYYYKISLPLQLLKCMLQYNVIVGHLKF